MTPEQTTNTGETPELSDNIVLDCQAEKIFYGDFLAVRNSHVPIRKNQVTGFIGPSGCGKSTVLKSINPLNISMVTTTGSSPILSWEKKLPREMKR